MKYLFHFRPPLAFFSCRDWLLHRLHDGPPFLSLGMSGHLVPVGLDVDAVVLEIAEEHSVFEINGIVPDLAFVDHAQDFRPDRCVIPLVTFLTSGLEPDHHSETLHYSRPAWQCSEPPSSSLFSIV